MDMDQGVAGVSFFDFKAHVAGCVFGDDGAVYFALGDGSVARLEQPSSASADRFGLHGGAILCQAAAPGGGLFTGGDDGRLMQLAKGGESVELASLPGRWIERLAVSRSGRTEGALAMASGKSVFYFPGPEASGIDLGVLPGSVQGLAFSPDGSLLAASHNGGVTVWDFSAEQTALATIDLRGLCLNLAFAPTGGFLAVASQEKFVSLVDLAGGKVWELEGYARKPASLAWTADGTMLLTSGNAGFTAWEAGAGEPAKTVFGAQEETYLAEVAAHPQFPIAIGGFSEGSIFLAELAAGAAVFAFNLEAQKVTSLAWSGDGMFACGGSAAGTCFAAFLPALLGA